MRLSEPHRNKVTQNVYYWSEQGIRAYTNYLEYYSVLNLALLWHITLQVVCHFCCLINQNPHRMGTLIATLLDQITYRPEWGSRGMRLRELGLD